jgi:hypothetical protein
MGKFLELLLAAQEVKPLLSKEHFSVDGTLLRAWSSHSSVRIGGLDDGPSPLNGGNGFGGGPTTGKKLAKGDFRGLLLSTTTHRSTSDGEARLFKKAPWVGAFLSFMGHCVMENRNGLVVASKLTEATVRAVRETALRMTRTLRGAHQETIGAEKVYGIRKFVAGLRNKGITPQVAQNLTRRGGSANNVRTASHNGYAQSINSRKRIEQVFDWIKQSAGLRQLKAQGRTKVGAVFRLHVVAYNLIRITNLLRKQEVMA